MIRLTKPVFEDVWVEADQETSYLIGQPTLKQSKKLQRILAEGSTNTTAQLDYTEYFIRCVVRDWKGFEEKCVVINGELKESLWIQLTSSFEDTAYLYSKFREVLKWEEVDEKKFDISDSQE